MADREFTAQVHDESEGLWAEVLELPGCFASGHTLDELREALSEAIALYLTDHPEGAEIMRMQRLSSEDGPRNLEVEGLRLKIPA